ncbi:hypothetical protein YC2023_033482 [Brassica napus]
MISVPKNRKKFAQDNFSISYILKLLDHDDGSNMSSDSKFLILILMMSLTSCNSARRKIVTSAYLKSIEKLAETENLDAKKLVKKLSMDRLRCMLGVSVTYIDRFCQFVLESTPSSNPMVFFSPLNVTEVDYNQSSSLTKLPHSSHDFLFNALPLLYESPTINT